MADIGTILFQEILKIPEYPGAPFTGEPVTDIIMFFFLPTLLLIIIIFYILGIMFRGEYPKFRALFGIGLYLFVVVGGYFRFFMLITGPIFLFLIFIVGVVFFIPRLFRMKREGAGLSAARGMYAHMTANELKSELARVQLEIQQLKQAGPAGAAALPAMYERQDALLREMESRKVFRL